jgi:PAP2 superfamily C-terminal
VTTNPAQAQALAARPFRSPSLWLRAAGSLVFRLSCYAAMVWMALLAEARPAPTLPDFVLPHVPLVPFIERYNYWLWIISYVPIALWLFTAAPERFIRYMVSAGLLGLLRGACILATGLGAVSGVDRHAGMSDETRWNAFLSLGTPWGLFNPDAGMRVYLTKDLFFSGHTATTLLLLLYVWPWPKVRWAMLALHVLVVASVFLAHLHYTIDIIGAYAITFSLFALREWNVRGLLSSRD